MDMPAQMNRQDGRPKVPFFVPLFNPLARRLLGAGLPLGPNALLTVRGRKSGQLRTTPVALVEINGRRWIIGTFGEVNWVRNLRANGDATINFKRRQQSVRAVELSMPEAAHFFREQLTPYVNRIPFGRFLIGSILGAREILADPDNAATRHPVFELQSAN
jgi:deazaflavin-dependent oxidoreductase (nitroreductase family)